MSSVFRWRSGRPQIIGALLAIALLLSGCSTLRIGYATAPDLAYWWLDRYVDFDGAQATRAREAIRQWFAWNRRTQVPDYAALVARARVEVLADTTAARACAWQEDLTKRARLAFDRIAPAAADLMLTITPEQVRHIEQRYDKFNDEFKEEYLQADPKERQERSEKRAVDRAETLYGRLEEPQRAVLAQGLAKSPFDAEVWFAERRQRQQDVLLMLRSLGAAGATREQALQGLQGYADRMQRSPRPAYQRYAQRLSEYNCALAASLHNATTGAQRRTAAERLAGWEGDLRAIAAGEVKNGERTEP